MEMRVADRVLGGAGWVGSDSLTAILPGRISRDDATVGVVRTAAFGSDEVARAGCEQLLTYISAR